MQILSYGEDALTFWALQTQMSTILGELHDNSKIAECMAFYRPSFGRSGGEGSSQFGEFDFLLLTRENLYLGESKWDKSTEKIIEGDLHLREEQLLRHKIFRFYVEEWAYGNYADWKDFMVRGAARLCDLGIKKPIAPEGSLLAENLKSISGIIKKHYAIPPKILNMLLYFCKDIGESQLLKSAGDNFLVIKIAYSTGCIDNFIKMSAP
jgi:hypothetical protein